MLDVPLNNDYCFDNVFFINMSQSHSQDIFSQNIFCQDIFCQDIFSQNIFCQDLIDIFIVLALSVFSLICSTLFVSNCVYKKMVDEFVTIYNSNTTLYEYDPYFYKYLDDYDLLEKQELSADYLNSLNTKYIKETTPLGLVILTYNNEYNSFDYYCKKSTIVGFNYLEVVSRIYVANFDCKVVYSDNYDNLIMLYNKKNGILNNDKEKCYGDSNGQGVCDDNVFFTKKVSSSKKMEYYNFVSNKYKYKGTLDDFDNYIKTNNLISIERSSIEDNNTSFFSLEKNTIVTELDELNISFKTFKSLSKVKTL